nr:hypothetical protein [Streptomyces sp. IMTB 2501]
MDPVAVPGEPARAEGEVGGAGVVGRDQQVAAPPADVRFRIGLPVLRVGPDQFVGGAGSVVDQLEVVRVRAAQQIGVQQDRSWPQRPAQHPPRFQLLCAGLTDQVADQRVGAEDSLAQ